MGAVPVCAGKTMVSAYQGFRWVMGGSADQSSLVLERPPQLEPQTRIEDTIIQDWRWLALRCERRLTAQAKRKGPSRRIAEVLGEHFDIDQFACFVPRTVLEAIADNRIRYSDDFDIIIENFNGAVVFCDASGFTALTEALDKQANGAEKLGECINNFFAPLIQIVNFWGGDIIKFSGDALTIVWPVDDDPSAKSSASEDANGGDRSNDGFRIDRTKACRLACQCCLDLHNNLNYFPTPVTGKFFALHIGVGFGRVTILQVGGTLNRWEYVVAGPPMQEISIAEPLAASGETVISPTVVTALGGEKGARLEFITEEGGEGYARIFDLKGDKVSPPPPLENIILQDTDVELLKRFIPPAVFKRLTAGYNVVINELRRVSVVFVGVHGLDVSTDRGSHAAHRLMQLTQKAAYTMEGSVNKFLVDDKGVLILIMFGLPPVYHLDDALRAVMAALRVVDGLKTLGLTAGIGVATGRVWCGTVGCDLRKEYTAMGDTVNLSARLMGKAQDNEINCDLETKSLCDHVMDFRALPAVKMKGKRNLVPVFQPTGQMKRQAVLQTTTGEPISTWQGWKYKRRIYRMFFPSYEYRNPIVDFDKPPLDYPLRCGPMLPWEYAEPWMSSLRPTIDLGGVAVMIGKETEGTTELVHFVSQLSKNLGRSVFLCSNMPDSTHVNIGNVPLLAWRKLCTEMVEQWRWSDTRDAKGYSKVDRDNSMYGLSKELVHPIFHWRLQDMKSVIHGLVLPCEVPENQLIDQQRAKQGRNHSKKGFDRLLRNASNFVSALKREDRPAEHSDEEDSDGFGDPRNPYLPTYLQDEEEQSLAPVICSLVNGFSMYECSIVVLHVRSGTSLFASMDSESWKVARLVGRIAMMRRRRKIELDMKEIKRWRRKHSRTCAWCRGTAEAYRTLNSDMAYPTWTAKCRPPPSKYFPPFLFVLVCSEMTGHVPEQQELIEWAKESNCLVQMKQLSPVETGSYLAHCLSVKRAALPDELIEYVYRISAGIPKYIYLTANQLRTEQAIIIEKIGLATEALLNREASLLKYKTQILDVLKQGSNEVTPDVAEDDESPKQEIPGFKLSGVMLTGDPGIPEDATTSDADSEKEGSRVHRRLHGGKLVTVYKFKQQMEFEPTPAPDPLSRNEPVAPKLTTDELRVAEMYQIDPDVELEKIDGLYVRRERSRNDETSPCNEVGENREHFEAFKKAFHQKSQDFQRYGRNKFELPLRDQFLTEPGKNEIKSEPDWESREVEYRDRSHPRIRKPFLPPGPEVFTSRVGFLSHPPPKKTNYSSSMECQLRGPPKGSVDAELGPLSTLDPPEPDGISDTRVRVIKDLKKVPFVSELRAAAMSLMERLEPDEQLASKVASVFPVAFTGFELQAVYPRPMSAENFQRMIQNLVTKEMLECCEPPSEEQLQELDLIPLQDAKTYLYRKGGKQLKNSDNESVVSSEGSLVSEIEPIANRWGFDEDGNPVFYRLTSIAFQHVVADLLMSAERSFLARISRKVICFRRTYGLSFLMKQINAKLIDSPMDAHEPPTVAPIVTEEEELSDTGGFANSWNRQEDTARKGISSPTDTSRA